LSILHRATGAALSLGTLLVVWWLVGAATSDSAYAAVMGFIDSPIGYLLLFGLTVALWYHFCAGLRHLAWDARIGLELPQVHRTGQAVIAGTAILTVLTWVVGLIAR
jgi:succinate dehydrogenase / fumarate reductase cytochrome b subunit